ncbi:CidA/LrgA family protein [Cohnella faecalis]|uniref:CidA/LrgA family holin-like protein n=1 Tax=Cohnella faecalis TaxID=2315694 RepID=A0A398CQ63_9BACL|nr:CidA/LrgA family holin-like protein [Cohnella faecalis]RIE03439.1 CidA/LrgA family holin-like protein [Cohnella faecalis]
MKAVKNKLVAALQISILYAFALVLDQAAEACKLPIPGSIIGMALLFALLRTGAIKLRWIEAGARWLIAEMLLFFIPATAGIVQFKHLLLSNGLSLLLVIVVSTFVVMLTAGMLVDRIGKRKEQAAG